MNRLQILTGACNPGENCYAVGSVEGVHFTAYAAGCNIAILAGNFERVQIIPGVAHGNIKVTCIDCSSDTGKIAASYGKKAYIFEPTPIAVDSLHKLDYRWYKTAEIETECYVNCLSWNLDGSKLLTGGDLIQIWQFVPKNKQLHGEGEGEEGPGRKVHFQLGDTGTAQDTDDEELSKRLSHAIDGRELVHEAGTWDCVWKCKPATPVYHLQFSYDGFLFASAGKADRLVKIWYEDLKVQQSMVRMDSLSPRKDVLHYSFVYIAHPRAVTGFTWRKTSKYMPRGAVANMLVTSCLDNVSRIWVETILPDDGLVDVDQFDPSIPHDPKQHHNRSKNRFIQRLKTIRAFTDPKQPWTAKFSSLRHAIHKRRKPKYGPETVMSSANLSSMSSVHDFHRFAIHHNGVSPVLHFHLAGSINPETDLPLLPLAGNSDAAHNFRLHWLDNKELQFTMEAEKLLQELHTKLQGDESLMTPTTSGPNGHAAMAPGRTSMDEDSSEGENECEAPEEPVKKKKVKKSFRKKKEKEKLGSHANSSSSIASEEGPSVNDLSPSILERLDRSIDLLLKDWQSSSDMLFSIHPVDGSFLMWHVDWLDEYPSQAVRQAQVSFASRLPKAFPIPDASNMACNLLLYCNYSRMDIKSAMKITEDELLAHGSTIRGRGCSSLTVVPDNMLIPNVLLVTKHHNGSLNQWQVSFTDSSKFQQVVSVAHTSRACGHRFRANTAACHPVLPLLLTTSHHNLPDPDTTPEQDSPVDEDAVKSKSRTAAASSFAFCSELILWQVGHVGPLSKTGGIMELARINSPDINAFTSMAWVPTLLPSTSLGSCTYSPSTLFVASDGSSLRLYQAVIDARLLLSEPRVVKKFDTTETSSSSATSSSDASLLPPVPASAEMFNLVSLQSSARPGCILELESINDATADWQNIQLLHVFQEPLVADHRSPNMSQTSLGTTGFGDTLSAYVDLSAMASFEENFYLVVLERLSSKMGDEGSRLHMWKITISSQPTQAPVQTEAVNGIDGENDSGHADLYDSDEEAAMMFQASQNLQVPAAPSMKMSITTVKVCSQTLSLPTGVCVISANVAAGHLSSASIYPACFAPYLLTTACSDGHVRFWKCHMSDMDPSLRHDNSFNITSYHFALEPGAGPGLVQPAVTMSQQWRPQEQDYWWAEWQMMCSSNRSSAISVPGKPITVSCAYSGRVAVAYRRGNVRAQPDHPEEKFVNLNVAIYECESTGGSDWVLEDTIELENIKIPDPKAEIELSQVLSAQPALPPGLSMHSDPFNNLTSYPALPRTKSVPSLSTIQSVRKSIAEQGNRLGLLKQKCLVMLDWVSAEDGSHILTVGVGTKIFTYCQVSSEVAQSSIRSNQGAGGGREAGSKSDLRSKTHLQKSKSLAVEDFEEEIRWMRLRAIELETADSLPPLPMHTSWVRGGILVIGMDNEFHVYTQWRGTSIASTSSTFTVGSSSDVPMSEPLTPDKRTLTEANLASIASSVALNKTYKSIPNFRSSVNISSSSSSNKKESVRRPVQEAPRKAADNKSVSSNLTRTDSTSSLTVMHDFGLFEAARLANPVLPQYHPEQLKALLSIGKIRRVKAILAHLLRCIIGTDNMQAVFSNPSDEDGLKVMRPRSRSVSTTSEDDPDGLTVAVPVEDAFDFLELNSIPPLPIYALMAADADNTGAHLEIASTVAAEASSGQQQDYTDLFSSSFKEETLDLSEDGPRRHQSGSSNLQQMNLYAFTPVHSKILSKQLMRISLPGLNSLDQMYLVAMADTVAHCKMDFADRFAEAKEGSLANDSQADLNQATELMDDCGLRFVLAMRQHIYLLSTLPKVNRVLLQRQGLRSYSIVWAFHSEAYGELLSMIPCMQKDEPTWEELRQFGLGWWLTNPTLLRTLIERVAKVAFQRNKEPMDSALFYLAMKKKNVLWGLFRSVDNHVKADFFRKDFTQDAAKRAAKKNAFHLMGKQKFMDSAALFLLAGSLQDAIMVILDKLQDFQLALVVCRLYEIDDPFPDSVCQLLHTHILGIDSKGENSNPITAHPDPFLRSMAYWMVKDYQAALNTLLDEKIGHSDVKNDPDAMATRPNIFSFYNYLRTHPLLLRLRLAATTLKQRRAILTGFTRANSVAVSDKITTIDRVTWRERKLFFATATTHLKNGCPLLALEVMTRLPPSVDNEDSAQPSVVAHSEESITTGILGDSSSSRKAETFDWGTPVLEQNKADSFDWGTPVATQRIEEDFDWGTPLATTTLLDNDLELDLKLDSSSEEGQDEDAVVKKRKEKNKVRFELMGGDGEDEASEEDGEEEEEEERSDNSKKTSPVHGEHKADIMAQQFKYIACLKILMEELSTLATGFEVDGGQLRYQLYVWLEKEVEVLKVLCNYGQSEEVTGAEEVDSGHPDSDEETGITNTVGRKRTFSQLSDSSRASLHETILADKYDLDFKERRLTRRKRWLRQHQHLLRTLASYCILQGSSGGGLASVHMELLLLLQELQQERAKQQLKSPLPFPTTLPLLTASLSSSRTVIADPIQYLQRMISDLLNTVTTFPTPPSASTNVPLVVSMRNLAVSLSSCIYQCLCDSDTFSVNLAKATDTAQDTFMGLLLRHFESEMAHMHRKNKHSHRNMFVAPNSSLMAGILRQRQRSIDTNCEERINTPPAKWPGVTSLQCLLLSAKDEDAPKLQVMLCEALLAVYLTLLINGLALFDPSFLYRLLSNRLNQATWGLLFGGGCRTILRIEKNIPSEQLSKMTSDPTAKQRLKFNMKVMMGPDGKKSEKDTPVKETYKERFIAPEISMISYFTSKPVIQTATAIVNYDSDNEVVEDEPEESEEEEEEAEASRPRTLILAGQQEHCDPNSYSWCLMRYATLHTVLGNLRAFLPQVGIELSELPIVSPMLHTVLKLLERWEALSQARLELFGGPPDNYIPGLTVEITASKPSSKLEALFSAENTPFINCAATLPVKRFWFYLLRQDNLQEVFLRYIYRRPPKHVNSDDDSMRTGSSDEPKLLDAMKIVHKEQDIITSFCINQANMSSISLATQNKLLELDIGLILHPPSWLADENEYDIEMLRNNYPSHEEAISVEGTENWLVLDVKCRKLDAQWMFTEEFKVAPVHRAGKTTPTPFASLRRSSATSSSFRQLKRTHSAVCTCSGDIIVMCPINSVNETMPEFLVVHTPQETPQPHSGSQTPNTPYPSSPAGSVQGGLQSGRGASVVKSLSNLGVQNPAMSHCILDRSHRLIKLTMQRTLAGVRKMASHPSLQYYLTGSQDGAVRLWEWDHRQPVTLLRSPGNFPKVTKALFNQQGNKCCVSDGEGSICLWQVGLGSNFNKPIMSLPCHNKTTSDFTFVGCSSLIATAGHSTENKNVCLWDTLMPPRQALVHAFVCHEHGSPAVIYAPQSQTLISGGRKGEINHFDLRQRKVRNTFPAHDSAIKCLAIDPQEEFYVTGSAEGDIKVWALNSNQLAFSFQGEHSKNTFFRSVGSTSGVTQVALSGSGHLFSCGADGSIKFRQLPEKEMMTHHFM